MSTTPDRAITGLTHRRPSAASLLKENRPTGPAERPPLEVAEPSAMQTADERPPAPAAARPARGSRRAPATSAKRATAAGKVQIAVEVPEGTRNRARAAFRAAAYFEDVATFSDFVSNAIEAEIRRLEDAHNGGQAFEPITANLPAGRPAGR